MKPIIKVENLSKRYRLGTRQAAYDTLREALTRAVLTPFRRLSNKGGSAGDSIWALKDVSFEVAPGEVVGIIGRNGAGKSTLLKVLSRITEPTKGRIELNGKVGSLLEVGTGFHPELTGRENVYLNGATLGMRRAEIAQKFDQIVEFAEMQRFLDTPVKRYSSGMYMRLAFAVAAHLEPEVLLVDEVLAVGDAAFQAKCLGKMGDISQQGRTVLFVSHNMGAVQRLCKTAYLLQSGEIVKCGDVATVINSYYESMSTSSDATQTCKRDFTGDMGFVSWSAGSPDQEDQKYFQFAQDAFRIRFHLEVRQLIRQAYFGVALYSGDGMLIWAMRSEDQLGGYADLSPGSYEIGFHLPCLPLRPGTYRIHVSANTPLGCSDEWHVEPPLTVLPKNETGLPPKWQGILNLPGEFAINPMK